MNISFDFEETGGYEFTERGKARIEVMRQFVAQRLRILEDEINAEGGRVVLQVLTGPTGIKYYGFSHELTDKMKQSLTESDFAYIISIISKGT
jgi:hypothetical protein